MKYVEKNCPVIINIADLVDPQTGKTWRQKNNEKKHNIPIGTLVSLAIPGDDECCYDGIVLHVIRHSRDCDGTPLYSLGVLGDFFNDTIYEKSFGGFDEGSLKVVK